ncbi:hypothetical protein [Limosilactobacillus reuteri]|jgi:hypothetical protein|nr:hypothetical protein [Limosilactobacillus reuteri]
MKKKENNHYSSVWDFLAKKWWIIVVALGMIWWILASLKVGLFPIN